MKLHTKFLIMSLISYLMVEIQGDKPNQDQSWNPSIIYYKVIFIRVLYSYRFCLHFYFGRKNFISQLCSNATSIKILIIYPKRQKSFLFGDSPPMTFAGHESTASHGRRTLIVKRKSQILILVSFLLFSAVDYYGWQVLTQQQLEQS